jgi:hypothetical protein
LVYATGGVCGYVYDCVLIVAPIVAVYRVIYAYTPGALVEKPDVIVYEVIFKNVIVTIGTIKIESDSNVGCSVIADFISVYVRVADGNPCSMPMVP